MGWKFRRGRAYFYKSEREGGRVVSTYFGASTLAEAVAMLGQEAAAERAAERDAWRAQRERIDARERDIAAWYDRIEAVADAAMLAAGYHQHKGQWRRRRDGRRDAPGAGR